jgi:hypothetical protein
MWMRGNAVLVFSSSVRFVAVVRLQKEEKGEEGI